MGSLDEKMTRDEKIGRGVRSTDEKKDINGGDEKR